ncbi:MAG: hypothetical protein IPO00_08830 [Betaproteobacteria bacterium]|nr:hypothetical protein [Betaproteobacteria bacterium]
MSGFNPSQVSFAAGEWSPAMSARVDLAQRQAALKLCQNFKPRPQGPALMRAGSIFGSAWTEADHPRLFEMRVSGSDEDYVVAVGASKVRVYNRAGLVTFYTNLIANGTFDSDLTGWTVVNVAEWEGGHAKMPYSPSTPTLSQSIATTAGHTYQLRFRAKGGVAGTNALRLWLDGVVQAPTVAASSEWISHAYSFVGTGAPVVILFEGQVSSPAWTDANLDDVVVYDENGGFVSEFDSPWTADQLAGVQYSPELSKDRVFFARRGVQPSILALPAEDVLEFYPATFANQPDSWGGANWPGVVESGFQGRLWLASTPNDPHVFWASKSGSHSDFDLGTGLASDGMAFSVTTKGQLEWMQGQRVMLVGSESAEHVMQGASGLIKTSDIDIQDGSGFGSAAVQARHIGDQVLFVTSDRRKVRALDYSWEKQAWYSKAITWAAEHLIDSAITELHFSRTPDPTIIAVLESGELRACTYDRGEGVAAWWRVATEGTVHSAAVARTADGDELWISVTRGTSTLIERIPLHEAGAPYADSARMVTIGPAAEGGEWLMPTPAAAGDLPYVNAGSLPMTTWAPGTLFGLSMSSGAFIDNSPLTFSTGLDLVFTDGGRLNVVATLGNTNATVRVIVEPSAAVKAALVIPGGTIPGGTGWNWATPTTVSGLDRLEGMTVRVIIDGALGNDQVVTDGFISLSAVPVETVVVGLPYSAKLIQLPLEGGLATGSSQSAKRRRTKVRLRLNDSALPLVNGKRAAERFPSDPMDTGTNLITGDADCIVLGWEEDGALTIEQDLPFRTEILAIFGSATANEV